MPLVYSAHHSGVSASRVCSVGNMCHIVNGFTDLDVCCKAGGASTDARRWCTQRAHIFLEGGSCRCEKFKDESAQMGSQPSWENLLYRTKYICLVVLAEEELGVGSFIPASLSECAICVHTCILGAAIQVRAMLCVRLLNSSKTSFALERAKNGSVQPKRPFNSTYKILGQFNFTYKNLGQEGPIQYTRKSILTSGPLIDNH